MMATRDVKASSRHRSNGGRCWAIPIKCSKGNLGKKDICRTEEKEEVDDCQEDQDTVLGLHGGLIYT